MGGVCAGGVNIKFIIFALNILLNMKKNITLNLLLVLFCISLSFSQNGKELFKKGKESYNKGNLNDALSFFDKATKKDSSLAEVPFYRALTYYCLNKYDEVKKDLQKAEVLNSKNPEILNKIANLKIGFITFT